MSRFNHLHRLLDAEQGGFWSIGPTGAHEIARGYLDGTNILRTAFTAATGRVAVTDFMPVGRQLGAGTHDYVSLTVPRWLVRRIEGLAGAGGRGRGRGALSVRGGVRPPAGRAHPRRRPGLR